MNHVSTDDIHDPARIPTLAQDIPITRIIDIHVYDVPQPQEREAFHSIESTLTETEEAPQQQTDHQSEQTKDQPDTSQETTTRKKQPQHANAFLLYAIITMGMLLLVGGSLTYVFPPTVTITITPTSTQVHTTGTLTLVTPRTAHPANNEVPGRILPHITMSQSHTQATTGRTYQEDLPSQGTITFYNAALYPQTIVAGTLLTGASGVQVATDQSITVPAATYPTFGEASVPAHAIQPGTNGNIKAGDIYGSCCLLNISAVSSAFTGGKSAEAYQSVAKLDIETAATSLKTQLTQAVTAALHTQVHEKETLLTPPECKDSLSTDHQEGDKATSVQVTVTLACTGITYETQSFKQLIINVQTREAGNQHKEHYRLSGEVHPTIQSVTPGNTKNSYQLTVETRGTWVYHFSNAELAQLAKTIAGKTRKEATAVLLHTSGITQVDLGNAGDPLATDPQKIRLLLLVQQ